MADEKPTWKELLLEVCDPVKVLDEAGLDDFYDMCEVIEKCMKIYVERNPRYGDNWKRYGWLDSFFHMRHKFSRIEKQWWSTASKLTDRETDSQHDLIVYTIFMLLNIKAGNERGV